MEPWQVITLCITAFAGLTVYLNRQTQKSLKRLTRNRGGFDLQVFRSQMQSQVSDPIVIEVLDLLTPYVGRSFPFLPTDRPIEDYEIDDEDLSDLIHEFATSHKVDQIAKLVMLPDPLTIENLIVFCSTIVRSEHPAFHRHQ